MTRSIETHSLSGHLEDRASSRSRASAVALARVEHLRDLQSIALSVGLGGGLWLVFASLARLWQ
jgi:hypothetical protein